jgi:hypothetical protein
MYTKAKRTLHPESLLYIEMEKLSTDPPNMFEKIFFKEIEGVPDHIENALRCWDFAFKVGTHLKIAISKVTEQAHKKIEDKLKLMNHVTKKDGFRWRVSGEESSQVRRVSIESKDNNDAGLRTINNYNNSKPKHTMQMKLLKKSVVELRKNSADLSIDAKKFADYQQHLGAFQKETKKAHSKQIRRFRSQLLHYLVKLYELKSNNSGAPEHSSRSANAQHLEKIQDLIVGFYSWLAIDVPYEREEDWEDKNWEKTETGLVPNFIHSFDAKHMENVINSLNKQGLHDIWAVHDSFGVHACDVDLLMKTVKDEFVGLHKKDFTNVVEDLCKLNNINKKLNDELCKAEKANHKEYESLQKIKKPTNKQEKDKKAAKEKLSFSVKQSKSYVELEALRKEKREATEVAKKEFEKGMENAEYLIS